MIIRCKKKCLLCVFSSSLTRELKVCVCARVCARMCVCVCVRIYLNIHLELLCINTVIPFSEFSECYLNLGYYV